MAKRPIVVDTTIDSQLAAFGVNLAKDVPIPKANAPRLASELSFKRADLTRASTSTIDVLGSDVQRANDVTILNLSRDAHKPAVPDPSFDAHEPAVPAGARLNSMAWGSTTRSKLRSKTTLSSNRRIS